MLAAFFGEGTFMLETLLETCVIYCVCPVRVCAVVVSVIGNVSSVVGGYGCSPTHPMLVHRSSPVGEGCLVGGVPLYLDRYIYCLLVC